MRDSSHMYFLYLLFKAFKIHPKTTSDPREVYVTLLQEILEIAHIFSLGITKQSEWTLNEQQIFSEV